MPPGHPEVDDTAFYPPQHSSVFSPMSAQYLCSPDDVVIGTNLKQTDKTITIMIHFDYEAISYFESLKCYDDLFGADITPTSVYVFIRGDDQNPIINATTMGEIAPTECSWRITTDEPFRNRQKVSGTPTPVLEITLVKAPGLRYVWPKAF